MQFRVIMVTDSQTNKQTNTNSHKLTRAITIHCATVSLARSVINNIVIANFNPENPGIGTPKSRDFWIGKWARILGFRDPDY